MPGPAEFGSLIGSSDQFFSFWVCISANAQGTGGTRCHLVLVVRWDLSGADQDPLVLGTAKRLGERTAKLCCCVNIGSASPVLTHGVLWGKSLGAPGGAVLSSVPLHKVSEGRGSVKRDLGLLLDKRSTGCGSPLSQRKGPPAAAGVAVPQARD